MDNQNNFKKDGGVGPIIGSTIIIILIVLGGLYFWSYTINKQKIIPPVVQEQEVEQVDSKDIADPEVAKINNELNATSTDSIEADLNNIDATIDATLK
jgi:hypothetical protein